MKGFKPTPGGGRGQRVPSESILVSAVNIDLFVNVVYVGFNSMGADAKF
jgi:hypothetical protein